MRYLRAVLPSGLTVMSDLYKDHLLFAALIAGALVAGAFLIPQIVAF